MRGSAGRGDPGCAAAGEAGTSGGERRSGQTFGSAGHTRRARGESLAPFDFAFRAQRRSRLTFRSWGLDEWRSRVEVPPQPDLDPPPQTPSPERQPTRIRSRESGDLSYLASTSGAPPHSSQSSWTHADIIGGTAEGRSCGCSLSDWICGCSASNSARTSPSSRRSASVRATR
jgi:hypothetical protein